MGVLGSWERGEKGKKVQGAGSMTFKRPGSREGAKESKLGSTEQRIQGNASNHNS